MWQGPKQMHVRHVAPEHCHALENKVALKIFITEIAFSPILSVNTIYPSSCCNHRLRSVLTTLATDNQTAVNLGVMPTPHLLSWELRPPWSLESTQSSATSKAMLGK